MNAFAKKRVEVGRENRRKRFPFAGLHFRACSRFKHDGGQYLLVESRKAQGSLHCLGYKGIGFGQKIARLKLEGFDYLYTAMHDTTTILLYSAMK